MFKSLRLQIIHPCKAHCKWCGTWKKNNTFHELSQNGGAGLLHDLYSDFVKKIKPNFLFLSGGEPLLLPHIDSLLLRWSQSVRENIFLFTSFQFSRHDRERMRFENIPWDKTVLTHTTAGFNEELWDEMTGFPFDSYVDNIKELSVKPWKKLVKFILNHDKIEQELHNFVSIIKPDESFFVKLKLMNNQSGDFGKGKISETKRKVRELMDEDGVQVPCTVTKENGITGKNIIKGFLKGESGESCPYRGGPQELRFAFFKGDAQGAKLKYRFCPYFPSDKHFIFKTSRDSLDQVYTAFYSKKWHKWCSQCRLRLYV